jgi:hypothetical protein
VGSGTGRSASLVGGSCWTLIVVRAVHGWGVIVVASSRCMGVIELSLLHGCAATLLEEWGAGVLTH